jgi:hypothetical protein
VAAYDFQAREFARSLQLPPVSNPVRHIPVLIFVQLAWVITQLFNVLQFSGI